MVRREYKYARRNFSQSTRTRHRMSFCIGRYARRCNVYLILESNSEIFYIITKIFQRFWIELVILWILIYRSYWFFFFFLSFYCDILVLFDIYRNAIYIRQVLKHVYFWIWNYVTFYLWIITLDSAKDIFKKEILDMINLNYWNFFFLNFNNSRCKEWRGK